MCKLEYFLDRKNKRDLEHKKHIDALEQIYKCDKRTKLFDALYESLNILDAKVSTLLSFNSINIAITAIFLVSLKSLCLSFPFYFCITFFIISSIVCLKIIWIHWPSTEDLLDMDKCIPGLLEIRYGRTVYYRISWILSFVSVVILLFSIPITVILNSLK